MEDAPYNKREIDLHFEEVYHRLDDVNGILRGLSDKVGIQNGNVGNLRAWRTGISMVVGVVSFLVIPLLIYSFNLSQQNLKLDILQEIAKNNTPTTPDEIKDKISSLKAETELLQTKINEMK